MGSIGTQLVLYRLSGYHTAHDDIRHATFSQLTEYQATFQEMQPSWDDRFVHSLNFPAQKAVGTTMRDVVYLNMEWWLKNGFDELRCTAIIVQNDFYAIAAMGCLMDHGYRVPEDISVVGFDNERECAEVRPALTSVGGDMFELGSRAVGMLMRVIDGETVDDSLVPVSLYVRDSTGPPR